MRCAPWQWSTIPCGLLQGALFLLPQLRSELRTEILGFENLANLDLALQAGEGARCPLDPIDALFQGVHLEDPEPGDQFLGFGKRAVDDAALFPGAGSASR